MTPVAKAALEHLGGFPHWISLNESFCCVLPFFLFIAVACLIPYLTQFSGLEQ